MVTSLFRHNLAFTQFVNTVHLVSGFWRKHKFARVSTEQCVYMHRTQYMYCVRANVLHAFKKNL